MKSRILASILAVVVGLSLLGAGKADPAACGDPIEAALSAALAAYARGEIATARTWTGTALDLLERKAPSGSGVWGNGNADQLLDILNVYDYFARGQDVTRDAVIDAVEFDLRRIEWLHAHPSRVDRIGDERVDYDLLTHLVRRIGDRRIDYDLFTRQITRIGDMHIDYDLHSRMPRRIASIDVDYDLFDGGIRRIAGVALR